MTHKSISAFHAIHQVPVESSMYVFIRKVVKWQEVEQFFQEGFVRLKDAMNAQGVPMNFPPSIFIHRVDEQNQESELSAAIQTNVPVTVPGGGTIIFPHGKALILSNFGPPETTSRAHTILQQYVNDNGLSVGVVIEEYRSNLEIQLDPETWETLITYRLYNGVEVPRIVC